MDELELAALARFRRRFRAIDAEIPVAPPFTAPRPTAVGRKGAPWMALAVVAVLLVGVGLVAGPLLDQGVEPVSTPTSHATSPSARAAGDAVVRCGRIPPAHCTAAADLVAAFDPVGMAEATWIRMDDVCPPGSVCDRQTNFGALVVVGSGTEARVPWTAYLVTGDAGPETVSARQGPLPAHIGITEPPGTPAPLVSPIPLGDWQLSCLGVAEVDCTGAADRYINLLARDASWVQRESDGILRISSRPICPVVPDYADPTTCWEVTATDGWPLGGDWCMVIARGDDERYPAYVHVGGPTGTGSAEPPPADWPTCSEPQAGAAILDCGRIAPEPCQTAIELVEAFAPAVMVGATWIRMDDTCPEAALCDRRFPFDAAVVVGTGPERQRPWTAFHVHGQSGPEVVEPWLTDLPTHMGIAAVAIRLPDDAVKRLVADYGEDHESDWGGMYIDQDRGGMVVALFNNDLERHRSTLLALAGPDANLEVRGVEYNYAELKRISESLCREEVWFATVPAVLQGCGGVDQSENRIVVNVSTVNPDAAQMIEEHFDLEGKVIVEVDGTGAALLPRGTLRITAVDADRPVEGLQCSPVPDLGSGPEGLGPLTDEDGVCIVDLPATGVWVFLVANSGPDEETVATARAVVLPDRTTDVTIEVP
jgi:hypothetical protein